MAAELTASSQTIRFFGQDRYGTNEALALALRGRGDFPFDTSDRTSANAPSLASAGDWWGAATCPRSVIVVAGDAVADALAAASLSDPLDRSDQPRLRRSASADPAFDPPGGLDRVETAAAPIIVTSPGRSGSRRLSTSARASVADLSRGGCAAAREAIIVGGPSAVPPEIDAELLTLGYEEVFRVAGADRYETAALVARSLGTEAPHANTGCVDANAADGSTELGFYGNAVAEFRSSPTSCRLLPRAVALADGGAGVDALAAGWWTSRWQVPLLLTGPDGSLPPATRDALALLDVDTLIVLGGTERIPESTVDEATRLASALPGRIAGPDRYATSVAMARSFGGWFAESGPASFDGDVACIAASGAGSGGWADALAGGPLCASLGASDRTSPSRALTPFVPRQPPTLVGGSPRSHDAVPILLVETGAPALPASVRELLRTGFDPAAEWCAPTSGASDCLRPGFAAVLGGPAATTASLLDDLDDTLSGGRVTGRGGLDPALVGVFATTLDMGPVYAVAGAGPTAVCVPAGGLRDARWLSLYDAPERRRFLAELDVAAQYDGDDSLPSCLRVDAPGTVAISAVSAVGAVASGPWLETTFPELLSSEVALSGARSGAPDALDYAFSLDSDQATLRRGDSAERLETVYLDLGLRVEAPGDAALVSGTAEVATDAVTLAVTVSGSAVRTRDGWIVRGSVLTTAPDHLATGGFTLTISDRTRVTATWRFDGFVGAADV